MLCVNRTKWCELNMPRLPWSGVGMELSLEQEL